MAISALLELDLSSSGEHWETDFICKYGVIAQGINDGQDKQDKHITEMVGKMYQPYKYAYTAVIPDDHHVDKLKLPENLKSVLKDFRSYKVDLIHSHDVLDKDEYEQTIMAAEYIILCKGRLDNPDVQGNSLIMQLFMEHEIPISLKTQDWIANSLQDIYFDRKTDKWSYHHIGNDSTVFKDCLPQLISSVETKQQFIESNQAYNEDMADFDNHIEDENDMEI